MANLSKTRILFGFTSPRTIEKIIPEIGLLTDKFSGQEWSGNQKLQTDFFELLFKSEFYDGEKYPADAALAARDRITRAPKALGFVDLKPRIELTSAGKVLFSGKRIQETITKQLLKFQFPSPYHDNFAVDFFVKPYLELIRLISELDGLSKTEVGIFFLQLTHINKFELVANKIKSFREKAKNFKGSRKSYKYAVLQKEILEIYAQEIKSNNLETRESDDTSLKKFMATKASNMRDYADAFVRYIRSTELVTFEKRTYRLVISPTKKEDVNFLLSTVPREPISFKTEMDFKSYLFNPDEIQLLTDSENLLIEKLNKLGVNTKTSKFSIEELKDLLEETENQIRDKKIAEKTEDLKLYKEYGDILEVFSQIQKKETPDQPLFLEWNTWRAFVMLDHASRVDGNFALDIDGMPLNTAPGKMADIEVEYEDFGVIVEVTMSSGQRQYEMEGEPVPRHFGIAKQTIDKELYCIFVAPVISPGTLAHYFNLNRINTKLYGGRTKIIPLNIEQFLKFFNVGAKSKFDNPKKLKSWLEGLWLSNQSSSDEAEWVETIDRSIDHWV